MAHKVISAYATLRVPNDLGQEVLIGFYKDAILPASVNREDLARHIRKGMVAKADESTPEPTSPEDDSAAGKGTAARPAGNASRDDWVAYATSKGASEEQTRPVDQGGLSRDDLRAKYGNGS